MEAKLGTILIVSKGTFTIYNCVLDFIDMYYWKWEDQARLFRLSQLLKDHPSCNWIELFQYICF